MAGCLKVGQLLEGAFDVCIVADQHDPRFPTILPDMNVPRAQCSQQALRIGGDQVASRMLEQPIQRSVGRWLCKRRGCDAFLQMLESRHQYRYSGQMQVVEILQEKL